MRLESVTLHNVGPFRDFTVDLERLGEALLVAVTGANGAGKSTMLELALPGALYRECPTRGSIQDLAIARDSFVEARVTNGATYTIRHSVDAVSKKGETLVLDADGKTVLPSTSVKVFDAWAARHLPTSEVLLSSVFAAQATAGFLGAKPGERKGILLRTLGIERYEDLAEKAREHARGVKAQLDTLRARIEDERRRGGDVEAIERELAALEEAVAGAELALTDARGALMLARSGAPALEVARREAQAVRQKRAELAQRIGTKRLELDQVLLRIRNNREVLADATEIRAAKARSDELTTEIARLGEELKSAEAARLAAVRERDQHAAAEKAAEGRATAAASRAERARKTYAERERVQAAAAEVPRLLEALENAAAAEAESYAALEAVRGERLAGADDRIAGLRKGHQDLVEIYLSGDASLSGLVGCAEDALATDDAAVCAAVELPGKLRDADAAWGAARVATELKRTALREARMVADLAPAIEAAQREASQATDDNQAAQREALAAGVLGAQATERAIAEETARGNAQERRAALQREQQALAALAGKAVHLATAEGRVAELEPQAKSLQGEIANLEDTLDATPEPPETPAPPDVANLEAREKAADEAAKGAAAAVTLAKGRLERAQESVRVISELDEQRVRLDEELADWTRLGADLGRDGLQALEIDAVGPTLTEMTNDLLRSCFGPRWTVSIETTRPSSDGKRMLEGCEVRVIDTVNGRDAEASTFSGGEKVILSEALSLALTMIACQRSGLQGPTIVRDESGAALDASNARAYVAMIRRAAELIGASRVLLVSHSPEVQELCDARIDVGTR